MRRCVRYLGCAALAAFTSVSSAGCSILEDDSESGESAYTAPGANDYPWEVRTRQGELVLPNVFYADASETEQMIPPTVHGRFQIDRLVYPTLGNPNLYVKADAEDAILFVLRIEEGLLAHLSPSWTGEIPGSPLTALTFPRNDETNGIHFFLVPRDKRAIAESAGPADPRQIYRISPNALMVHPIQPTMPAAFAARRTVRVEFNQQKLQGVPPGLYDIRFEVRKDGRVLASEFQYNAVRVFDRQLADYSIVNVTDTQVTVDSKMESMTYPKLREFVQRVNLTTDEDVRNAAFITFNGDLHNGGSADLMFPYKVANTYRNEAEHILDTLKDLRLPIFLTAGNHDGYVSTGHPLPGVDGVARWTPGVWSLKDTVRDANPRMSKEEFEAWWARFEEYRDATADTARGGRHLDVFGGKFSRRAPRPTMRNDASAAWGTWRAVDPNQANWILYDGFNQWQRTYGPLYTSWDFGATRFVNLNTYELRQHRRSGWGMYTVNYGGGISRVQNAWAEEELARAEREDKEVVLIGHHDPRGGHNGADYPYQFGLIEYKTGKSSFNYLLGEVYNPFACKGSLDWVRNTLAWIGITDRADSCLHDGLQEWMRPDEFDCSDSTPRDADGKCVIDPNRAQDAENPDHTNRYWSSGFALIHKLATRQNLRTMLLGHTHYNSLEILQSSDEIVPGEIILDSRQRKVLEALEAATPLRQEDGASALPPDAVVEDGIRLVADLAKAGNDFKRHMQGDKRELLILRATSAADLTSQRYDGKTMMGYATLKVSQKNDARSYARPQINEVTFYINDGGNFELVKKIALDRTQRVAKADPRNPVNGLFTME